MLLVGGSQAQTPTASIIEEATYLWMHRWDISDGYMVYFPFKEDYHFATILEIIPIIEVLI